MRSAFAAALVLAVAPAVRPVVLTAPERAAARTITADALRGHIRFLSSDLLGGRGPATSGDRLAQEYIAAQMEAIGLEPGAPGGGWLQPFDIVGVTSHNPDVVTASRAGEKVDLKYKDDYIAVSGVENSIAASTPARLSAVSPSPPVLLSMSKRAMTACPRPVAMRSIIRPILP